MSILFPVTGNGGSQSKTNLQLRDVLARHHLQYGFHVVNFVICPTVKEALEAPIEEWKREFAEFAEWSWEIKDSAGTVGLWRGQVDRQREASLVIPASTVGAVLALLAATLTVSTALDIGPFLSIVQNALSFAATLAIAAAHVAAPRAGLPARPYANALMFVFLTTFAIVAVKASLMFFSSKKVLPVAAAQAVATSLAVAVATTLAVAVAAGLNLSAAGAQAVSAALAGLAAILLEYVLRMERRRQSWRFWGSQSKQIWSYFWNCFETIRRALSTRTIGRLCWRLCSRNGHMEFAQREHLHLKWCRRILYRDPMVRNHRRKNT